jgi:hypothetical protein
LKSEIKEEIVPPPKAVVVVETGEGGDEGILRAIPVDPETLEETGDEGGGPRRDEGVRKPVPPVPMGGGSPVEPLRPAEPEPNPAPRAVPVNPDELVPEEGEENL